MKIQKNIWLVAILIAGAMGLAFHISDAQTTQQPTAVVTDTNSEAAITARYRQGLIGKDEAVQESLMLENKKSLDIYGKIVDQYGQPVIDAKVEGSTLLNVSIVASGGEVYHTKTDANGNFSFIGIHGVGLGITPQKEGYFYDSRHTYQRPEHYQPDPNNPALVTMWRIRGPEPLVGQTIGANIPYDGTPTVFDIATRKQNPEGDLKITLSRLPLSVRRGGQKFDWTLKIEIRHGGLVSENDLYPYWAPANGYQPSLEFNMSSNNVPWRSKFTQDFYIKSAQGQFGRMHADIYTSLTPARIKFDFTINPSGSQNLEPAFSN